MSVKIFIKNIFLHDCATTKQTSQACCNSLVLFSFRLVEKEKTTNKQINKKQHRKDEHLFICLTMESLWVVDHDVLTAILLVFIRRWRRAILLVTWWRRAVLQLKLRDQQLKAIPSWDKQINIHLSYLTPQWTIVTSLMTKNNMCGVICWRLHSNEQNREHWKYFWNAHCVLTNHMRDLVTAGNKRVSQSRNRVGCPFVSKDFHLN